MGVNKDRGRYLLPGCYTVKYDPVSNPGDAIESYYAILDWIQNNLYLYYGKEGKSYDVPLIKANPELYEHFVVVFQALKKLSSDT
jgi:hypothetical protein